MKIAIIGNGQTSPFKKQIEKHDFIIAADGGANHCYKKKIRPHLIIGDLDSITKKVANYFSDVPQVKIPNQNKTDIEKIFDYIKKNIIKNEKVEAIDLFGVTSVERMDHSIANIFLLKQKIKWPLKIFSEYFILEIIDKNKIIKNKRNKLVSIFPLTRTEGLELTGFKWSFNDRDVKTGNVSISNVVTDDFAEIKIKKGQLILIINK